MGFEHPLMPRDFYDFVVLACICFLVGIPVGAVGAIVTRLIVGN